MPDNRFFDNPKMVYPPMTDGEGRRLGAYSTYLHAGSSNQGWPADHKAEDTFEVPTKPAPLKDTFTTTEYAAVWNGSAQLVLNHDTQTLIATFEIFADAQTAAKALNELKGY